MTRRQSHLLVNQFNHLNTNQQFQMTAVNDLLSLFEENINPGDPTELKLYFQTTKNIDKATDKLDISV